MYIATRVALSAHGGLPMLGGGILTSARILLDALEDISVRGRAQREGCNEAADSLKNWEDGVGRHAFECKVHRCILAMDFCSSHSVLISMLTYLQFPCLTVRFLLERIIAVLKHPHNCRILRAAA